MKNIKKINDIYSRKRISKTPDGVYRDFEDDLWRVKGGMSHCENSWSLSLLTSKESEYCICDFTVKNI